MSLAIGAIAFTSACSSSGPYEGNTAFDNQTAREEYYHDARRASLDNHMDMRSTKPVTGHMLHGMVQPPIQ